MYYLYIYLDPRKSGHYSYDSLASFFYEPIYVGKGNGNRLVSHLKEAINWKNKIKTKESV